MIKNLSIILTILFITACDSRNTYLIMMEAGLAEQFSNACKDNTKCVTDVETYMEQCFDTNLALKAINTKPLKTKYEVNKQHILKIQRCLAKKSGDDYWQKINMPELILKQVKQ
ncbi:MAG TPA: hypothetical protein ENG78_01445 [Acidiferrobacteraceae bacterium]|jgi:hypothetical protein|nr:hypothetical protein [Acidiferrobacteraceae bacterium]HEX19480.1 hypothetical protein [Acidiferrobacteraceae bacterium]